ncbi:phage antirepressor KilAC domain-containing protein [Streptobacillus moniliformis]|uniref:phage antirepressor KilAC domain-containing protein n=1 Tax=Streptobacillus moniliformis TaxID=34105 RepID=UPI0007E31977|nr:phage antirepressor KilAC domain-containing protein [Streptobacillus moniliformis]
MELIEIKTNEKLEPIISGRELHEKLEVETKFSDWIKRMIEYGFSENIDFTKKNELTQKREGSRMVERNLEEYYLNIDMAKEICMIQRNEIGKTFRKYFIQVEKEFNSPEKIMARAVLIANNEVKRLDVKVQELENKIEEDKPKVLFANALEVSNTSILVGELAKLIKQNGVDIGANRLFEWLRQNGYLGTRGENRNVPTQKSMDLKLMVIKKTTRINHNGSVTTQKTPKITGKGQQYFINKFLKNKEVI